MTGTTSGQVTAPDGFILNYTRIGTGPMILWIIGGTGIGDLFRHIARQLKDRFTSVYYNRRGFLTAKDSIITSPLPPSTVITNADDCAFLIQQLSPGRRAFVFGNCAGGTIAADLATRYPELIETVIIHELSAISTAPILERDRLAIAIAKVVGPGGSLADYVEAFLVPGCPDARALEVAFAGAAGSDVATRPVAQLGLNSERAMQELAFSGTYKVNVEGLERIQDRVILMGGTESVGYGIRRPVEGLANEMQKQCWPILGGHTTFLYQDKAREFAKRLIEIMRIERKLDQDEKAHL